ncbi:MAG: hypothetical protein LBK25_08360 [Treponema sp.]|jgi:hypothetical protein|nr:hypothetical protein [Treponema sp.]
MRRAAVSGMARLPALCYLLTINCYLLLTPAPMPDPRAWFLRVQPLPARLLFALSSCPQPRCLTLAPGSLVAQPPPVFSLLPALAPSPDA